MVTIRRVALLPYVIWFVVGCDVPDASFQADVRASKANTIAATDDTFASDVRAAFDSTSKIDVLAKESLPETAAEALASFTLANETQVVSAALVTAYDGDGKPLKESKKPFKLCLRPGVDITLEEASVFVSEDGKSFVEESGIDLSQDDVRGKRFFCFHTKKVNQLFALLERIRPADLKLSVTPEIPEQFFRSDEIVFPFSITVRNDGRGSALGCQISEFASIDAVTLASTDCKEKIGKKSSCEVHLVLSLATPAALNASLGFSCMKGEVQPLSLVTTIVDPDAESNAGGEAPASPAVPDPAVYTTSTSIDAGWVASTSGEVSVYQVKACSDTQCSTACTSPVEAASSATTASITGLSDGVAYHVCVAAIDTQNNSSGFVASAGKTTVDVSPPTVPTLSALPDYASGASLNIAWSASPSTDVASYHVKACQSASCDSGCSPSTTLSANELSKSITGLIDGSYYTCLKADDLAGNTTGFQSSTGTTIVDTALPAKPTVSDPSTYSSSADVTFAWTASSSSDVASYSLKACTDSSCSTSCSAVVDAGKTDTSKSVTGLVNGLSYHGCVEAIDLAGNRSGFKASDSKVTIDIGAPLPATVDDPTPSVSLVNSLTVNWAASTSFDVVSYDVKACTDSGCSTSCSSVVSATSSETTKLLTGLADGVYYGCVAAIDADSNSSGFAVSTQTSLVDLNDPANPAVSDPATYSASTTVNLTWTASASPDVASYNVKACTDAGCSTACSSVVSSTGDLDENVTGLANGSAYYACVQAVDNAARTSDFVASTNTVTIDGTDPDPATTTNPASYTTGPLAVNWTASPSGDVASYNVKACTDSGCSTSCTGVENAGTPVTTDNVIVADGLTYYTCVQAVDLAGRVSTWDASSTTVISDLTNPTNPVTQDGTANIFSNGLTVNWTASTDANLDDYNVKACTDAGCSSACVGTTTSGSGTTSRAITGLAANTDYHLCVQATDAAGRTSAWDASTNTTTYQVISVEALYPTNGAKWNDYVNNNGSDVYTADDTACSQAGNYYASCIHGGEKRKVVLDWISSCSGLSAADNLGVFDWSCQVIGGWATMVTSGLKDGKYLSDLIDPAGAGADWKDNFVTVTGSGTATSVAKWWTNTVSNPAANTGSGNAKLELATASNIYVVESSTTSSGYFVDADKIGFVVMPGATLTYSGNAANNYDTSANATDIAGGDHDGTGLTLDTIALLGITDQSYTWIEGSFSCDAASGTDCVTAVEYTGDYGRISQVTAASGTGDGVAISNSSHNSIDNLTSKNNGAGGVTLMVATHNDHQDIVVSGNTTEGVKLAGASSTYNRFLRVRATHNEAGGFSIDSNSDHTSLSYAVLNNNNGSGIIINNADHANLSHVLSFANNASGIDLQNDSNFNSIANAVVYGSGAQGILISSAADNNNLFNNVSWNNVANGFQILGANNSVYNLVSAHNTTSGIQANAGTGNGFHGNLLVGHNASDDCDNGGVSDTGIDDVTCTVSGTNGSSDFTDASSNAALRVAVNPYGSFVQEIGVDDVANASDSSGSATFPGAPASFDWTNFDRHFRGWGKASAGTLVSSRNRWLAGNGSIWDFSLTSTDVVLRNKFKNGLSVDTFTPGSACPASLHGNQAFASQSGDTYLTNAIEITDDAIGDNDGLCESGEGCVFGRNLGFHQGQGGYTSACTFTDGTVTGVTVVDHVSNGYADTVNPDAPAATNPSTWSSSATYGAAWTASAHGDIEFYNVKACTNSDCATGCTSASQYAGSATSGNVSGLANGSSYYICVQAQDYAGNTSAFDPSSTTISVDSVPPSAVTTTDPIAVSFGDVVVNWTGGSDSNFSTFNVKACTNSDCATGCLAPVADAASPATLSGLVDDTAYYACVESTDLAGGSSGFDASTNTVMKRGLNVNPVYPTNGARWNEWVEFDNTTLYNATDAACDHSGSSLVATCLHGGEMKEVVLTGVSSCSGLGMSDDLGIFDWLCDASSGTATFYSNLKRFKGVMDLVNAASWKNNHITLTGHGPDADSTSTTWWTNTVQAAPDNTGGSTEVLSTAYTVYTIATSDVTPGYNIAGDSVIFAVLRGATLTHDNLGVMNYKFSNGLYNTGSDDEIVLLGGAGEYIWVEGTFDSATSASLTFFNTNWSRFNLITTFNGSTFRLQEVDKSYLTHITSVYQSGNAIFSNTGSDANHWDYVLAGQNSGGSTRAFYITEGVVSNMVVFGSESQGLRVGGSPMTNIVAFGNGANGFDLNGDTVLIGATAINNDSSGIMSDQGTQTIMHGAFINNDLSGIRLLGASNLDTTVGNIVAANNNNDYGIAVDNSRTDVAFTANVLTGSNGTAQCYVAGAGAEPGIDANCDPQNNSDHTKVTTTLNIGNTSFVGKIGASDSANSSANGSGEATFPGSPETFDWSHFEEWFRVWGVSGSAFPSADHDLRWTTGTGAIWDLQLRSADTVLRNTTVDGSTQNAAFVGGAACPAQLSGNTATTDQRGNTFLTFAYEILHDPFGDNDGLCESNEHCIYTPNFGAYQGHGDYRTNSCTFTDGTISGVTMYAFPNNGR